MALSTREVFDMRNMRGVPRRANPLEPMPQTTFPIDLHIVKRDDLQACEAHAYVAAMSAMYVTETDLYVAVS